MIHPATIGRAFAAAAHDESKPYPWVAVSANKADHNTTLADVPTQLNSPDHAALARQTAGGHDALGVWADGAEAARVVPHADVVDGARWGLEHRQKAVLHWHPDGATAELHMPAAAAPFAKRAVLHHARVAMEPTAAIRHFQSHGINYLTVVPGESGSDVYAVDTDGVFGHSFAHAARPAIVTTHAGTATFLGDDDSREKGAEVYRRVLAEDAGESPVRMSARPTHYPFHHFTTTTSADEVTLDPNHAPNKWSRNDYRAYPVKRVFGYIDPHKREQMIIPPHATHYMTTVPADRIRDLDATPAESMAELHALPESYDGVKWNNTIQWFHPVTVKRVGVAGDLGE